MGRQADDIGWIWHLLAALMNVRRKFEFEFLFYEALLTDNKLELKS
jgi:hypothetical protein